MKRQIVLSKYGFPALISLLFFCALVPMVFYNNDSIAVVTAVFIDSGSILQSIFAMVTSGDWDQNLQYHTSIYGWPNNQLILWYSAAYSFLAGETVPVENLTLVSRVFSLAFTTGFIFLLGLLFARLKMSCWSLIIALIAVAFLSPVVKFAYEIHPEPIGLFFATASLLSLLSFINTEHNRWLYLGWFFAAIAFCAKQPFIVYLLPPFILGILQLVELPAGMRRIYFLKTFFAFFAFGLLAIFLSNPYALLNPVNFIDAQIRIHSHHSDISKPFMVSLLNWLKIAVLQDLWFGIALIISVFFVLKRPLKGRAITKFYLCCAIINITYFAILVTSLDFFFFRSYLIPVIPTALVMLLIFPVFMPKRKLWSESALTGVALLTFSLNVPHTSGMIVNDKAFLSGQSMALYAKARKNSEFGGMKAVFSSNLPLGDNIFAEAKNTWQFGDENVMVQNIVQYAPDVMFSDPSWGPSNFIQIAAASKIMGYENVEVSVLASAPVRCDFQFSFRLSACLADLSIRDREKIKSTYTIYYPTEDTVTPIWSK